MLKIWLLLLLGALGMPTATLAGTDELNNVQSCLDRGLAGLLNGDITLINTWSFTIQVAALSQKQLSPEQLKQLHQQVRQVMLAHLGENSKKYIGSIVEISDDPIVSSRNPKLYTVSGIVQTVANGKYHFTTQVLITEGQCQFGTLTFIIFNLSVWLNNNDEIKATMREFDND